MATQLLHKQCWGARRTHPGSCACFCLLCLCCHGSQMTPHLHELRCKQTWGCQAGFLKAQSLSDQPLTKAGSGPQTGGKECGFALICPVGREMIKKESRMTGSRSALGHPRSLPTNRFPRWVCTPANVLLSTWTFCWPSFLFSNIFLFLLKVSLIF